MLSHEERNNLLELQRRLAHHDQLALKGLYDFYSQRLYRFAFAIIQSRELAEEIVGDVFLQIWHHRVRVSKMENLNWYLHISARNVSLNYYRKSVSRKKFDFEQATVSFYQLASTPEDIMISREVIHDINRAINELPARCRLIFKLVKEDSLTYRQVASLLNLSIKTVENQMGIALKKLQEAVGSQRPQMNPKHDAVSLKK